MKKFLILASLFLSFSMFSQTLSGKVLDEKNLPVAGANIYFDGTTIATISDENGNFKLNYSSKTNSLLAISFIGYQTQYIQNIDVSKELKIVLLESNNTLNEVIVKKDRFSRKQKLQLFKEQFLGQTSNAKLTRIENEDDLYFDYDEKAMILKAYSENPLTIINDALGYKISYELVDFEANFFRATMKSTEVNRSFYAGLSRFEEIKSDAKKVKKREKSFKGSQIHFFRNLVNNVWNKDNFLLFKGSFQDNPSDYFQILDEGDYKKVMITKQTNGLASKNFVAEFNLLFDKKQQSRIVFETETFYVDKFGNNSNIENIIFSGYLSSLKVGDMLPLNYGIE